MWRRLKGRQRVSQGGKKPKKAEGGAGKAKQGNQEAPRCACRGAEGRCDPDHDIVHHKGNDVADELANLGRIMPEPCTDYHSPLCGEERVHMVRAGRVCEGDITDEIKEATSSEQAAVANNDAGGQGTRATAVRNAGGE